MPDRRRRRAAPIVLLIIAGIAIGLLAEEVAFGWKDPRQWIPDLVVGLTFICSGAVVILRRPGTGWLLVATGFAWFAGNFAGDLQYLHRGPLLHAIVVYVGWRARSRVELVAVITGYLAALLKPLWDNDFAALVLLAGLLLVVLHGGRQENKRPRWERRTAIQAAVLFSATVTGFMALDRAVPSGLATQWTLPMYEAALCIIAVLLAARLAPAKPAAVADLVVELGESPSDSLRDALAEALGDGSLQIGYLTPDGDYAAADGTTIELPTAGDGRVATMIEREGNPFAVLLHDATVASDPAITEAVATATRLSAANAVLAAEVQEQVTALEESRRRLLLAADSQRRRLDVRLQEGAEARIVGLAARLGSLPAADLGDHIRLARLHLGHTIDDLHDLAQGLHPRALELGLGNALADLARRCPIPIDLHVDAHLSAGAADFTNVGQDLTMSEEVAVAAYYVCAEALANIVKHAAAAHVTITAIRVDDHLRVSVADDGKGGADPARGSGLRGLTDRVQAIGGALNVTSPRGGPTRLVAELPLGHQPHRPLS